MNKIILAQIAAISIGVAACASSGTMVTEQQAQAFQKGVSTRDQVIKSLGAPNSTTIAPDGTRIDVYIHVHAAANGASYIPIVGLMAGGATGQSNSATFTYDQAGVLRSVSTSASNSQVNTGLLNQN